MQPTSLRRQPKWKAVSILCRYVVYIVFLLSVCFKQNILSAREEKMGVCFFLNLLPFVLRHTLKLLIWLNDIVFLAAFGSSFKMSMSLSWMDSNLIYF